MKIKELNLRIKSSKHPILKKIAHIVRDTSLTALTSLACFQAFSYQPAPSQTVINNNLEMLNVDDYKTLIQNQLKMINLDTSAYHTPLRIPADETQIKVVIKDEFNDMEKQSILDTIDEYNDVFEEIGVDFRLIPYFERTVIRKYDVVINKGDVGETAFGNFEAVGTRFTDLVFFNQVNMSNKLNDNYFRFRKVFTHEMMHYFGAGDMYLWNKDANPADTVMIYAGQEYNYSNFSYLGINDLKFLFASYGKINNHEDINNISNYISEHRAEFNYYNQQSEKFKEKFGEEYLLNQAKEATGKDAEFQLVNPFDYSYYVAEDKSSSCSISERGDIQIFGKNMQRDLFSNFIGDTNEQYGLGNMVYKYGDNLITFNKNGMLENSCEQTNLKNFKTQTVEVISNSYDAARQKYSILSEEEFITAFDVYLRNVNKFDYLSIITQEDYDKNNLQTYSDYHFFQGLMFHITESDTIKYIRLTECIKNLQEKKQDNESANINIHSQKSTKQYSNEDEMER